jgi:hypothetical protein
MIVKLPAIVIENDRTLVILVQIMVVELLELFENSIALFIGTAFDEHLVVVKTRYPRVQGRRYAGTDKLWKEHLGLVEQSEQRELVIKCSAWFEARNVSEVEVAFENQVQGVRILNVPFPIWVPTISFRTMAT